MSQAYIVEVLRTAGGRRNGRLSSVHANDLGAVAIDAVLDRVDINPGAVEDVILGCVTQAGEQSLNIARNVVLASRLPFSVPAVAIDRQCGSSQQALQFAAQAVMSGVQDVVIAAGVESMSRVPIGAAVLSASVPMPRSQRLLDRCGVSEFSQFVGAEQIAAKNGFSRGDLDAFALESHRRASAASNSGAFDNEIVPVKIIDAKGDHFTHQRDEGIRDDASAEGFAGLKTLTPDGVLTAGNSSQICDGASAALIVSEAALKAHNLTPMARIVNMTVTGGDPVIMLEEPLFATERALKRAGLKLADIDLYEVNEAFASVPMAWLKHLGGDPRRLNVNGGAISLGHPLGASGTKLMATLVHALRARGGKFGLQTMCEGGGMANVTIVEAL